MVKKLLGKEVSTKIINDAKLESDKLRKEGNTPLLCVVRVGDNGSDISYEKSIVNLMEKANIDVKKVLLPLDINKYDFVSKLKELNEDNSVKGILIFRPLPAHLDEDELKHIINPKKDIDCFSPVNLAKVFVGEQDGFYPCTPSGVMEILDYYNIELMGKNVVMVGRSLVVGKPLSMMLLDKHATLTICHSRTKNLQEVCKNADILIAAVGRANMIDDRYIKDDATVIDVGINFKDGKMVGDVDFNSACNKAGMITPVPGGVGGVTTACLAKNMIKATKLNK